MPDMMITTNTGAYCVIGSPVSHSLSPLMHNAAFEKTGLDGAYMAFEVTDIGPAVGGIRSLGICGASITIPHKVSVMTYLDELDGTARDIGAVNTIVNRNGTLWGYNTDCLGAVKALEEKASVMGKRVLIVGAGGAARAVGFGIVRAGGNVTISNRSEDRGRLLAKELCAAFAPSCDVQKDNWDVVINTTSVGMTPKIGEMPIPESVLQSGRIVMDIVYNPVSTLLLETAAKRGCITVDGVAMFVYQGACQFELWTKAPAPVREMERVVRNALEERGR